jgi:hypothetical protein
LYPRQRWGALFIAVACGVGASQFIDLLVQPGPFNSFLGMFSRAPLLEQVVFAVIASVSIYNLIAVGVLMWEQRTSLLSCPPVVFSILAIRFFVAEQFGVEGDTPFYERYVMQAAPFLGIIGFAALPELNLARVVALRGLSALGQVMLWRYVFGG